MKCKKKKENDGSFEEIMKQVLWVGVKHFPAAHRFWMRAPHLNSSEMCTSESERELIKRSKHKHGERVFFFLFCFSPPRHAIRMELQTKNTHVKGDNNGRVTLPPIPPSQHEPVEEDESPALAPALRWKLEAKSGIRLQQEENDLFRFHVLTIRLLTSKLFYICGASGFD